MYPLKGSKTCCQGLVDLGLRIFKNVFLDIDLITSGTILFTEKSPPPMTFPARAVANEIFFFSEK